MVTVQHLCDVCKNNFVSYDEARAHEEIPITHDKLKPGLVFKVNPDKNGFISTHGKSGFIFSRRPLVQPKDMFYGIITGPNMPSCDHVQQYDVLIVCSGFLPEGYNPHWLHQGSISGDSGLIQAIPDIEFGQVMSQASDWVAQHLSYHGKRPEFELTNRL
jgi:hypothetical protein